MEALVAKCLSAAIDPGSEEQECSEEDDGDDRYDDCESAHAVVMPCGCIPQGLKPPFFA